ncbi:molybdate ABC transporter, inner membrane subunit [Chloroherpeton thalassium ATCC 35110]|uniref:Molybdenum transport system permease n=1 Tax=Chloroherpeton thalassium (strain ATCC 35110 / GB-78) TaxID=517418 RepID=B3QRT8_CHLT3|nr:molybdate ABC transporter permease subunit [Chloroherpeton thalassium]ACF13891.1 molybdate ABC transporter, inner membrane subunit [Chloroherpeton thalassium ATCC 35110]
MDKLVGIFFEEESLRPILLSLKVGALVIIMHGLLGTLLGYLLSKKRFALKAPLDALVTLPLIFPPMATGFLLLLLLGRNGLVGKYLSEIGIDIIFSFWGVFLAAFVSGLPLVVKPIQSAIENFGKTLIEAAYTLGKSELSTFFWVILPNIKKIILAGVMLSFGRSLGEVGITLMLGGNILGKTETISLAIYNTVFEGNFEKAMALSFFLALLSLGIFYSMKKLSDFKF